MFMYVDWSFDRSEEGRLSYSWAIMSLIECFVIDVVYVSLKQPGVG